MKIGDLVYCPVNLQTGEMFDGTWEMAVVATIYENEPKIGVAYVNDSNYLRIGGTWFTEELELINES